MSESIRTLIYAAAALVSLGLVALVSYTSRPAELEGFESIGEEFYAKFTDPSKAASLTVATFDEDTASVRDFVVEQKKDGEWVIPTHHNYPADARDRLNKTATSIIGIVRGPQKSRRKTDFEKYNVIDPLDEDMSIIKGRGQRITLKNADGTTAADYIIGKKLDGEGNRYYVRLPKENATYVAELDIDLSTRFSDWIEDDLLKVAGDDLTAIIVNKYSIDETRGRIVGQEISTLGREKFSDPWTLEGLNAETEELKEQEIRDLVSALDDLKIVGVRRKPEGLTPDLSIDPRFARSQPIIDAIVGELQRKGFFLQLDSKGEPKIYANEGNVVAATSEGIVYTLNFGEIFSGTRQEIEIGSSGEDEKDKESEEADDANPLADQSSSRYLFVTADFDAKYLGPEPTRPVEPTRPPELGPAEGEKETQANAPGEAGEQPKTNAEGSDQETTGNTDGETAAGETAGDDATGDDDDGCGAQDNAAENAQDETAGQEAGKEETTKGQDDQKSGDGQKDEAATKTADDPADQETKPAGSGDAASTEGAGTEDGQEKPAEPQKSPEELAREKAQADYDAAMLKYESDLRQYERDLKEYTDKVEAGKKKAKELNERFADWYYVISGESFETLRLARTDLIKPKEKTDEAAPNTDGPAGAAGAAGPGSAGSVTPGGGETGTATPNADTPKTDTPKTDPGDAQPDATGAGDDANSGNTESGEAGKGDKESGEGTDDKKSSETGAGNQGDGDAAGTKSADGDAAKTGDDGAEQKAGGEAGQEKQGSESGDGAGADGK